jgi:hypothetical protein
MPEHPAARTIADVDTILSEIQYFLDHPRTQQNQWVAKGQTWKPILQQVKADLQAESEHYTIIAEAYQAIWMALQHVGLEIHQRDRTTWAYRWHGMSLIGAFPSRAQALEAALRERIPDTRL